MKKYMLLVMMVLFSVLTVSARRAYITEVRFLQSTPFLYSVALNDGTELIDHRWSKVFCRCSAGDEVEYEVSGRSIVRFVNITREYEQDYNGNMIRVARFDYRAGDFVRGGGRVCGNGGYGYGSYGYGYDYDDYDGYYDDSTIRVRANIHTGIGNFRVNIPIPTRKRSSREGVYTRTTSDESANYSSRSAEVDNSSRVSSSRVSNSRSSNSTRSISVNDLARMCK